MEMTAEVFQRLTDLEAALRETSEKLYWAEKAVDGLQERCDDMEDELDRLHSVPERLDDLETWRHELFR